MREPFSLRSINRPISSFGTRISPRSRRRQLKVDPENLPPEYGAGAVSAWKHHHSGSIEDALGAPSPFHKCISSKGKSQGAATPVHKSPICSQPCDILGSEMGSLPDSAHEYISDDTAQRQLSFDRPLQRAALNLPDTTVHDNVMETSVKVIVRVRPLSYKEEQDEATSIVEVISRSSLGSADQTFTFDAVLGPETSQETVFQTVGLPLVEHCIAGFNSSIFAYGQTGSGKTFTMLGAILDPSAGKPLSDDRGLTLRVFETLFQRIAEEEKKHIDKRIQYQCQCSFLEIYNEQITDLLDPVPKSLHIREDLETGVYVENLKEECISNIDDVQRILLKGLANRRTGATSMNAESSRSHSVFTCVIRSQFQNVENGTKSVRTSRMNLVDLAGSERQKLTGASGERLKEAGNINRSLSQLGNLINILAEVSQSGKHRHIPYRDSRLTFLLQESLGGNARLAMICAVSPARSCKHETLSTLRFAQRAKAITNKVVVNEETENDVHFLREQVRKLKEELVRVKSALPTYGPLHTGSQKSEMIEGGQAGDMSLQSGQLNCSLDDRVALENGTYNHELTSISTAKGTDLHFVNPLINHVDSASCTLLVDRYEANESTRMHAQLMEKGSGLDKSTNYCMGLKSLDTDEARPQVNLELDNRKAVAVGDSHLDHLENGGSCVLGSTELNCSIESKDILSSPVGYDDNVPVLRLIDESSKCNVLHDELDDEVTLSKFLSHQSLDAIQNAEEVETCKSTDQFKFQSRANADTTFLTDEALEMSPGGLVELHDTVGQKKTPMSRVQVALQQALCRTQNEAEQLGQLVSHYKRERDRDIFLRQIQEDRIVRLQNLLKRTMDVHSFLEEELSTITKEKKLLQEKLDNNVELAQTKLDLYQAHVELDRYRRYFDLGEQAAVLEEVDSHCSKKYDMSQNEQAFGGKPSAFSSFVRYDNCDATMPFQSQTLPKLDKIYEMWELEKQEWIECETMWMSEVENLRNQNKVYRQLSDERKELLERERQCAEEMTEALQMAMKSHGQLLDQYAELQEEHVALLATYRQIRDGVENVKRKARKVGIKETRWLEAQAAEIMSLRLQQEHERKFTKARFEEMQAQLHETSSAVHAAGEILACLKQSEEALSTARESAASAQQEAEKWRTELEQLKRVHSAEINRLQQQLSEACDCQKQAAFPRYDTIDGIALNFDGIMSREAECEGGTLESLGTQKEAWLVDENKESVYDQRTQFEPFPQDSDSCTSSL